MSWVILSILAAVFWTVTGIIDKHIISDELKDPLLATAVNGIVAFIIFAGVSLLYGSIKMPPLTVIIITFAGVVYSLAILMGYVALTKGEVTRLTPLLSTIPIFVAVFAYFGFSERFTPIKYVGILLIVIGALFVSLEINKHKFKFGPAFMIGIGAAVFFAFRNVLLKAVTINENIWSSLFWLGFGALIFSAVIITFHHPHLRRKGQRGIHHLFCNRILAILGLLCFTLALSIGSVSLSSAIVEIKPMLVFMAALFVTKHYPKYIKEKVTKGIIIQKTAAIIMIISGALLVV